jgi:WD40 repeat protein
LTLARGRALGAALSDDGRLVAVFGDRDRKQALLQVHRLAGNGAKDARQVLDWSNARDRTTYCASFSPDGTLLALGSGRRLLLFDVTRGAQIAAVPTNAVKSLFPPPLRGPAVQLPGAHQVAFSADGSQLITLHAFGVNGVARWSVSPLKPRAWLKRPTEGGTLRQVTWDPRGRPWLVSSTYDPRVWVHAPKGDRFTTVRVLNPGP